jgi:hypothetical protein
VTDLFAGRGLLDSVVRARSLAAEASDENQCWAIAVGTIADKTTTLTGMADSMQITSTKTSDNNS